MELSKNDSVVMSKCNGSSQQLWMWKTKGSTASYITKEKSRRKPVVSASTVAQPGNVAQEIAIGDY